LTVRHAQASIRDRLRNRFQRRRHERECNQRHHSWGRRSDTSPPSALPTGSLDGRDARHSPARLRVSI